jgi:hypothetical protein
VFSSVDRAMISFFIHLLFSASAKSLMWYYVRRPIRLDYYVRHLGREFVYPENNGEPMPKLCFESKQTMETTNLGDAEAQMRVHVGISS